MPVWLLGVAPALAFESEPVDLFFEDTLDLFGFISVDTGYLPSQSSPISVRFHVTPSGGVVTEMEAVSWLEWPVAFKHALEGVPGEGFFGIDSSIDMAFDVHINVASIYQNSLSLWSEQIDIASTRRFDTLVLPGSTEFPLQVAVNNTGLIRPFTYGFDVVPGVAGLELEVQVYPEMTATMGGSRIETTLGGSTGAQTGEGGFSLLDLPIGSPGQVLLQSRYFADLSTVFGIVIVPSASLDTIIGDFELVAFDIPLNILSNQQIRGFDPVTYTHPLPALQPLDGTQDVGGVDVGQLGNLEIALTNLGLLGLEGTAHIEGGDGFSVFPNYFFATADRTDGVVVTFAPDAEGEQLATLVLTSNDPTNPILRVPLRGMGVDPFPDSPPDPDRPGLSGEEVSGCGCSASPGPSAVWLLLPLALVGRRRR